MGFFKFIFSKTFLWHLLFMVLTVVALIGVLAWLLGIYTKSGTTVLVPDLKGHQVATIALELQNSDLDFEVIDSVFREDARAGEIIDQIPASGKKVKKGRKVFLTINAYDRPKVKMPQLVDYSLRNAQVVLNVAGLRVGKVSYIPSEYNDLVLEQRYKGEKIPEGTMIAKGQSVDLVVGKGNNGAQVIVPQCVGLPLHEALAALLSQSLQKGNLYYDDDIQTSADSLQAVVYQQNPIADGGLSLPAGSAVHLWLTKDMQKVIDVQVNEE